MQVVSLKPVNGRERNPSQRTVLFWGELRRAIESARGEEVRLKDIMGEIDDSVFPSGLAEKSKKLRVIRNLKADSEVGKRTLKGGHLLYSYPKVEKTEKLLQRMVIHTKGLKAFPVMIQVPKHNVERGNWRQRRCIDTMTQLMTPDRWDIEIYGNRPYFVYAGFREADELGLWDGSIQFSQTPWHWYRSV